MNVLFLGNSHVYMHFMPSMLMELVKAEDRGAALVADQCTGEGVSLEWHWKNQATRDMVVSKKWDYVVLQDRAGGPLEERESFQSDPELNLYHPDGRHANPAGAYLTACVFYAVVLESSSEGLPGKLFIKGKNRVDLDRERALFMQKIAHETVMR